MKRLLCPALPTPHHPVELSESEARHAVQVMRLGNGDSVELIDGKGQAIVAQLIIRGKAVSVEFMKSLDIGSLQQVVPFVLELSVIKGEGMEWAIEKAVELGVQKLVPVLTAHTVVQVGRKGPEAFQDRWQKISDQALKQCGRLERMEVAPPLRLENLLAQYPSQSGHCRIWCDETSRDKTLGLAQWLRQNSDAAHGLSVLIGPEGGWSESERLLLGASCQNVSLGPLIMRAETAAIFTSSLISAHLRAANSAPR
jgi:16S rRNA (uracil1498-N3)-methyltransferase